jgi:hypothetical protein
MGSPAIVDAAEVIGMSTAVDADRNTPSGYIAAEEQSKPEMLTQRDHAAHFLCFEIKVKR